ncbi:hypothetical protein [Gloeobacter kilaueensis]|nr:hypothetical protein [Gloeobacter kilaueensis]
MVLALLALAVSSGTCQAAQPYRDLILGFQFVPPPGWELGEVRGKLGEVALVYPAVRGAVILLTVRANARQKDDGKPATPAQLVEIGRLYQQRLERGQLGNTYRTFRLLDSAPGYMGNFNTAELLFRAQPARRSLTEGRIFVTVGGDMGRLVTILLVTPEPLFARLKPAVDAIARSFALL